MDNKRLSSLHFVKSVSYNVKSISRNVLRKNLSRGQFHNFMQNQIVILADKFDLKGSKEYGVHKNKLDGKRSGSIDVAWFRSNKLFALFEIDSAVRTKSMMKLLAFNVPFRFWVYYGRNLPKLINFKYQNDPNNLISIISLQMYISNEKTKL